MYLYLKVIYDVIKHQEKIKKAIKKYGFFAEHNYLHYLHSQTEWNKNIFFDYGNGKVLLTQYDKDNDIWSRFPNSIFSP